ncbi:MAG: insulinase family protein [Bacteroidales bacterium]|nr:insulinase family protein [Bacteroidales bacterium]
MYHYHTLNNGIRIIFRRNDSPVTHSGVYINIGSRDEQGPLEGIAHFIEHSIFKGTTHRRAFHIQNRIDGVGGELNAYTTKEETCIYASSLSIHLDRCLELFADLIANSTFPKHEIDKEKEVVIEEINSYKDSPADLIFDDFEEIAFGTHPIAHNILGTKKNVRHFTTHTLSEFFAQNYTPDRMVISVVGNADFDKLVRRCEKYFGDIPARTSAADRSTAPIFTPFEKTVNKHTHQVHALIGCEAPSLFNEKKTAFSLLNNILGGPAMTSRLNVAIRERYGFCYTIESQYTPFTDSGLFYIYAGIDGDSQERATGLILDELDRMAQHPLTLRQLRAAQQQYIGQMAISSESGLNEMQSIGKANLAFDHVDTLEEMNADIMSVTAEDLQQLAAELFSPNKMGYLYYK